MVVQPVSRPLHSRLDITGRTIAIMIASAILLGNVLFAPGRFADYYAYLLLTDRLYYFPEGDLFSYEAASNLIFLSLRWLTQSTVSAVNIAHYAQGIGSAWGFWYLAGRDDVDWRGLVFVFGLFGAALAFVTIRATPAYFLIAIAALEANKGRRSAIVLALVATLFHVSAVLALVPIIGAVLQNRLRILAWIADSPRAIVLAGGSLILVFLLLSTFASASVTTVIELVPFFGKYVAYTSALDPTLQATGAVPTRSVAHVIYLGLVSAFALVMLLAPGESCRRMRVYVLLSYTIFIFLQFSPVTAYRQSQFWVIPAAFVLPWRWFAPIGVRSVLMIVVGALGFLITFSGVVGS
jgi:hypothetical protein